KDTHTYEGGYTTMPPFAWGYADNYGSDYLRHPDYDSNTTKLYLKISNAVTRDGKPANLDCIRFVKIQTAQTGWSPNLGEISTEVLGIWRTH
ncbi:MAG: hypothetical protein HUK03_06385, partial [Bacteroidaceae bacterium]|nr:hypothetical protein [Bacteroidaceae bacterium]